MGKCVSQPQGKQNCQEIGKSERTGKIHPTNSDLAKNFYAQKKNRHEGLSNEDIDLLRQGYAIDGRKFDSDGNVLNDTDKVQRSKNHLSKDLSKTCDGSNPRSMVSQRDEEEAYPTEKKHRRNSQTIDVSREYSLCSKQLKMWLRKKSQN